MNRIAAALVLAAVAAIAWPAQSWSAPAEGFDRWLDDLRTEALARGVRPATLDEALAGVAPVTRVVELDRRQPEFTQTLWTYLGNAVTARRIERGRELLTRHGDLLAEVQVRFGVQPRFLVAFWGLETNFGEYTGSFPLVAALVTLAYDERRSAFFREQLLAALTLIDRGDVPVRVKASWAGAMGQPQFLPTTYRDFAVDFDGDGRRDLWKSLPDVFASAANYLDRSGWHGDRTWGREVRLPEGFDLDLSGLSVKKPLAEWQRLGVRRIDGRDLPRVAIDASLILPGGYAGPAFLVYANFRTTLVWNRSILYAVAVGHLADRLAGAGPLATPRPAKDAPLSRREVVEIQRRLATLGHDPGGADGVAGARTRQAIKDFQRRARLPADGFPSLGLLERLRATTEK